MILSAKETIFVVATPQPLQVMKVFSPLRSIIALKINAVAYENILSTTAGRSGTRSAIVLLWQHLEMNNTLENESDNDKMKPVFRLLMQSVSGTSLILWT